MKPVKVKKKTGPKRAWKMTPEVIGKLEEGASYDCSVPEMCLLAEINPDTYYQWIKKDKKFADRLTALRNKPVLAARTSVVLGLKNNPEFAMKYLERKKKKEFAPMTKLEHSGDGDNPIILKFDNDDKKL